MVAQVNPTPRRDSKPGLTIVHSSDLHVGPDSMVGQPDVSQGLVHLRGVLASATKEHAAVVILAGDTFDNNRQSSQLLDRAMEIIQVYGAPIVILPGNHDPLSSDSVYRREGLAIPSNLSVLGVANDNAVVFQGLGLEVWGKPHRDYFDMPPLREARCRSTPWQIAVAHGHYIEEPNDSGRFQGSWLIRRRDLEAAGADYVALGHWNRAVRVGDSKVNAYYSGSPDYAGTVNVVRLRRSGAVEVSRISVCGSKSGATWKDSTIAGEPRGVKP